MICTKCGARILDTDQFCPECGAKVIREKRCPDCGAVLREGTKFCHKCGRLVENKGSSHHKSEETLDIPIDAIERTIVAETEAKVIAERGEEEVLRPKKKKAAVDAPPKKKRPVHREEEDWEDDEEGVDVITIMTAVVGCVLLVVIAFLAYNLYRQYVPKDYEKVQEQKLEEQQDGQQEELPAVDGGSTVCTLAIVSNVNVRDNPGTEGTNVIKVAKAGETYECYGSVEDGNWYEIRLDDGTTGYVFKDYVMIEE